MASSVWYHTLPSPWFSSRAQATTREVFLYRLLTSLGRGLPARGDDERTRERGAGWAGLARMEAQVCYLHVPCPTRERKERLPLCSNLSCQNQYVPAHTLASSQTCQPSLLLLPRHSTLELKAAAALACLPCHPTASANGQHNLA